MPSRWFGFPTWPGREGRREAGGRAVGGREAAVDDKEYALSVGWLGVG